MSLNNRISERLSQCYRGKHQMQNTFNEQKQNTISDDEKILLLQYASKQQLNNYYECQDTVNNSFHYKWAEVSKIFKEKGYKREPEELAKYFLSMKHTAMSRFKGYFFNKNKRPTIPGDYVLANLFPEYFESLGFDMSELMTDSKKYSKQILEYLVPIEDQEHPTLLKDVASLCNLNDVESQQNLKRPHSEDVEGPSNKITKEVHEDEDVLYERVLDITRGKNRKNNEDEGKTNSEATPLLSLIKENNSLTDDRNALEAKLLAAEKQLREKDDELERKNLEISLLKERHANELEIEKIEHLFY
ncbi:uncharacterized protein LOC126882423 [Diabrotica virgifera virgifera]|uniref:Uncharacterized protein n=2 Tax=Diabrotica virgifera virgifera TaxID=50390 RepID=A0ABM5JZG1_DIAVI|nr:uncharacterized protein LOC126882423 [Diabrotica virgifera virgifera]